jgi:DNA-binding response OmpR family regulator
MHILIVEDDPRVADFLERGLRAEGYRVRLARNGPDAVLGGRELDAEVRASAEPAVILLDLMLPVINGIEVCQTLRASGIVLPVLMLTALGSVEDRVAGLRMGADDYLVKPFAFEELLARIEALMRRSRELRKPGDGRLVVGDLVLDRERVQASRGGRVIELTAKELALLELLMSAPGRVFSRERILANVWGVDEDPLTNIVDVYIRRLRAKVDEGFDVPLIATVRGMGYRMVER